MRFKQWYPFVMCQPLQLNCNVIEMSTLNSYYDLISYIIMSEALLAFVLPVLGVEFSISSVSGKPFSWWTNFYVRTNAEASRNLHGIYVADCE